MGGLLLNFLGIALLWLNQSLGGIVPLVFVNVLCFGFALTSVISALITFIIIKFPKRTGSGITALFAVLNGGIMLAPLLVSFFDGLQVKEAMYPFLMVCTISAILHVDRKMYDPPFPTHLEHLRRGSLIWKELHYRLALFFTALVAYGMVETDFSMWGFLHLEQWTDESQAMESISVFYLFLIVGQILLLVPLYLYSPRKIFYGLICLSGVSLYLLFEQKALFGIVACLALGGIGCSAIFPILISMMEKELDHVAHNHILPYIETGVSFLVGAYILGNAINDIWIQLLKEAGSPLTFHLKIGLGTVALIGAITLGLNLTTPKKNLSSS